MQTQKQKKPSESGQKKLRFSLKAGDRSFLYVPVSAQTAEQSQRKFIHSPFPDDVYR